MRFDPEKHHRRSIRLLNYDYSGSGVYFITICTDGREMLFGEVHNGGMGMNELGWIVWEEWERSADIRKEIEIGPFVVMPNHLHGVVTFAPNNDTAAQRLAQNSTMLQRRPRSLGSFVSGFKATTTYLINKVRVTPGAPLWQRNYYERLVRNEREMTHVWNYINFNPLQWSMDRENPSREESNPFEAWLYEEPNKVGRRS